MMMRLTVVLTMFVVIFALVGFAETDTAQAGGSYASVGQPETAGSAGAGAESAQYDYSAAGVAQPDVSGNLGEGIDEPAAEPVPAAPPARLGRSNQLDGIAAVVGDEIILNSELEAYIYMRLAAMEANPATVDMRDLAHVSLGELIDNKVLLVRAIEDSSIHVRNDEIESMLNNHINMILRQNGITMEQLDAQLRLQQGTTLARFRTEARRMIREQLYRQKLQQSYYFGTRVSRRDVELFFEEYRDSLPEIGESFELRRLSLRLASSDSVRQAAFDRIRSVKKLLDAGAGFAEMAERYSESPEGATAGGSLGFLEKGSTTEIVFEEQAFALPVGRPSEPFETRLGYHILLVEEKRDRRVRLRQILIRHAPTERERAAVTAKLDSLRQSATAVEEFEAAVKAMSVDNVTRTRGGDMGWVSLLEMTPAVRSAVQGLDAGGISEPVGEGNMLSIYMVVNRADSRRLTMENDYAAIAEKAKDIMAQKKLIESVRRWRDRVFIDVRI